MNARELKSHHKWKGNPRFKHFFEHTRFGFTLRSCTIVFVGLYFLIFAAWITGCGVISIFTVDIWKMCWKDGNPFTFGTILVVSWAPFAIHSAWTSQFKHRFINPTPAQASNNINLDKGFVEDGTRDGGGY